METGAQHRHRAFPTLGERVQIVPQARAFLEPLFVGDIGSRLKLRLLPL